MANLSVGIVGLPNVGKSTLFNALTSSELAKANNFPFCTIDPNVGVVIIPDPRLAVLSGLSGSKELIYATMEFLDIAGLVEGASKGEGLGNKFLANIRETDAILHVVRCFQNDDVIHVSGKVDPLSDIEVINLELQLADLQMIEKALAKEERLAKTNKEKALMVETLKKAQEHLNNGNSMRSLELTKEELESVKGYPFLTSKKVIYVCNVGEEHIPSLENEYVQKVREFAAKEGSGVIPICANIEAEVARLDPVERDGFLKELGFSEPGLNKLIRASFEMLGLATYLTTGEKETRAWTITQGMKAPEAAGKIHTDLQKGFIRAEVVAYQDMVDCGGWTGAREKGKARVEGKDYIVKDGDVIVFRHN